jgi:uracil-DNA glycosylase
MLTLNILRKPVDQEWTIKRIASEAPPTTWEKVFENAKAEIHDLSTILDEQERMFGQYYPLKKDIFAAFQYTSLANVKLVILGQDPYHQTININETPNPNNPTARGTLTLPRAIGLSFSVRKEDTIPSSLKNIYAELANTVHGFRSPDHGDLREWARQGVLLLNTCLTVRPGNAGSHGDIWLGFISKVFKAIAIANPYCIYMLWGREAQKVKPMLGDHSIILEAAHPSGLSARRGFFGCNHFNIANDYLIKHGKIGINWCINSIDESKNINIKVKSTNANHQPIFAPVNTLLLPTIIPNSKITRDMVPGKNTTAIGTSSTQMNLGIHIITNIDNPSLPTIPNTKNTTPITITKSPSHINIPSKDQIQSNQHNRSIPMIPKINFGKEDNVSRKEIVDFGKAHRAVTIESPQLIIPSSTGRNHVDVPMTYPIMLHLEQNIQQQTRLVSLPIINPLIK